MKKTLLYSVVVIILVCTLSSCTLKNSDSSLPVPETTSTQNTAVVTTQDTTPQVPSDKDLNPLTGLYSIPKGVGTRPVAIMINNLKKVRPQPGIDSADLYVEAETEGGITRLMAVFSGTGNIPDTIGPIRSARPLYIKLASSMGALYFSAGGDKTVLNTIKPNGVDYFNLISAYSKYTWRDAYLRKANGYEHSLMTSGKNVEKMVSGSSYSQNPTKPSPFNFDDSKVKSGSDVANQVQVSFSSHQKINFKYNESNKLYTKGNETLENSTTHKASNGNPIEISNIIIMYDTHYMFNSVSVDYNLSSGTGTFISQGTSKPIKWSRSSSQLAFFEQDGSKLVSNTGKTYICLVRTSNQSSTIVK